MNGVADLWTARNLWTGFLDGKSREFDTSATCPENGRFMDT